MKHSLTLSILLFITCSGISQKHEIQLLYKFGTSSNAYLTTLQGDYSNYSPDMTWERVKMLHDQSIELNYKHMVWKWANVYAIGSVELGKSSYYIPIINYQDYNIGNISFQRNRMAYSLGLFKRFELYNSKVKIDLGLRIKDPYPIQKKGLVESDWITSESRDWIQYKYSLEVHDRKRLDYYGDRKGVNYFLRAESFLNVGFAVNDNLALNLQFSYQRNNSFYYEYTYQTRYFIGNSTTPSQGESFNSDTGTNQNLLFKNDDFIYTSFGLTYNF
jgi:hypothetical protein